MGRMQAVKRDGCGNEMSRYKMWWGIGGRNEIVHVPLAAPTGVDAHMLAQIVVAAEGLIAACVGALECWTVADGKYAIEADAKQCALTLFIGVNAAHVPLKVLATSEAFATAVNVAHVRALGLRDTVLMWWVSSRTSSEQTYRDTP
jgi:hypothetical protein